MKNKKNVLSGVIILLATVIYFPVQAQDVVYQPDIKKSKLFWKAPKNSIMVLYFLIRGH